jgi:hypothetical protein
VSGTAISVNMSNYHRPNAVGTILDAFDISVNFPDDTKYTAKLLRPATIAWSNGSVWTKNLPPSTPTALHLIELSGTTGGPGESLAIIGWTPESDNENAFVAGYQGTSPGQPNDAGQVSFTHGSTSGSLALNDGYTYSLYIHAFNDAGSSAHSNTIVIAVPKVSASITANVDLVAQEPAFNFYALVVNGTEFQSGETVEVAISWTGDGGPATTDVLSATASSLGTFSVSYAGNSGAGFCPGAHTGQKFLFTVQATGLTSHLVANLTKPYSC